MRIDDKQILDWAIGKIKTEFKNDVALLIGHGFDKIENDAYAGEVKRFKGEFDYFVPESARAYKLSKSFIVNGVGYDLYPRNWDSITSMAELNDCHTSCLADANVLYARSEEDRSRFEAMRQLVFQNLNNPNIAFQKATGRLSMAMEIYQTMVFSDKEHEIRASSGYILDYLAQSVALINGNYFKRGSLYQLEEMQYFQKVPEFFAQDYSAIIHAESIEELKQLSHHITFYTQKFVLAHRPQSGCKQKPDYHGLADWYQEMGHIWHKIDNGCAVGDTTRVFFWGCSLQHELDIIREEFGFQEMDLLGSYHGSDLSAIRQRAVEIEQYITNTIVQNSVNIAIYANAEDFLANN